MVSHFFRRELEHHTDLTDGIDYPNLYTSALLVPFAIYVATLFSFAVRRTLIVPMIQRLTRRIASYL